MPALTLSFLLTITVTSSCVLAADKPGPEDYAVYVAAIKYIARMYGAPGPIRCVVRDSTTRPSGDYWLSKKSLVGVLDSGFSMSHSIYRSLHMLDKIKPTHWDSTFSELYGIDISHQLIRSFIQQESTTSRLESLFDGLSKVTLLTRAEDSIMRLATGYYGYWGEFDRRYPQHLGILELSRVGFSDDGSFALVFIDYCQGGIAGGEAFYVLRKDRGRWAVVKDEFISKY